MKILLYASTLRKDKMIIYNSNSENQIQSNKSASKLKTKRITKKNFKVKSSANGSKRVNLSKENQLYLKSIGLNLKK